MSCLCNSADIVTELTVQSKPNPVVLDYVWYDISNSFTLSDPSHNGIILDISNSYRLSDPSHNPILLNKRVIVSNDSGVLSLNKQGETDDVYVLPKAYNLVDDLFQNSEGEDYYQEYVANYQLQTNTSDMYDISLSTVSLRSSSGLVTLDTVNRTNNNLTVNLESLLSRNCVVTESVNVHMGTSFDFLCDANVLDVSNNLTVKLHSFGVDTSDVTLAMGTVLPTVSLYVNSLSNNSTVYFESDSSENRVGSNAFPKPSLALSKLLGTTMNVRAGRQLVNIPVTLPKPECFKSGCWHWYVYVVDKKTGYVSTKKKLKVTILSPFSQPLVSVSNFNFASDISGTRNFNVKYALNDVTNVDISSQGGKLGVTADVVTYANNVYTVFNNNWLAVNAGSENMSTLLSSDASANFVLSYDQHQYIIENLQYYVRITYTSTGFSNGYVYLPINVSGITHTTRVVVDNNYNGTFTLSGGNKANVGEAYYYKVNGDNQQFIEISGNVIDTTKLPFTGKTSFVCAVGPIIKNSVYASTVSLSKQIGLVHTIGLDISTGLMFGSMLGANVYDVDADGNIVSTSAPVNAIVQTKIDDKSDLFVNLTRPAWFVDVPNLCVEVSITESTGGNNFLGFDLSGCDLSGGVLVHALRTGNTYLASIVGASRLALNPVIDLTLAEERLAPSELKCVVTLKYNNGGNVVVIKSVTTTFIIATTVSLNSGNRRNNLILPNKTKINLSRVFNGAMTPLSGLSDALDVSNFSLGDVSTNTWRNLALDVNSMFYANLVRKEFMGVPNHTFNISGLRISTSHENNVPLNMYLPYSVYGSGVDGQPVDLSVFGDVSANFSTYGDVFLDVGFFTGVVDIDYYTVYRGELSARPNTLRVFVLPRPNVTLVTRDPSENVCRINAPTWVIESVRNAQTNENVDITYCARGDALGVHDCQDTNLSGLLRKYTAVKFVNHNISAVSGINGDISGLFDVSDGFTDISYGSVQVGLVKFEGVDLSHNTLDVSGNLHVLRFESFVSFSKHPYFVVGNILESTSKFKIFVINDTDEVMAADTILTTNVHVNSGVHLNNISIARYVVSMTDVDLTSDEYSTSAWVFVENSNHTDITVKYGNYGCHAAVLQFAQRGNFLRNNGGWAFNGTI